MPPPLEQKTIAAYLDQKIQQIDTLIEKKQRPIDLLKEQRTAVINQAVTKGLNPNVKMKDSGIEWIGEVPRIPVPPITEQEEIVFYLDKKTQQIDTLTQKIQTHIALLKEYRTALISEAVTGKIDLRDYREDQS